MLTSSNIMQNDNGDFADFRYNRNDFNRKVSFQINRSSPITMNTNPSSFPPLLPDKRTSWKRVFQKFSSKQIRLTVIKLDGSSFDVFVTKKATVGKVKRAIEAAFSHLSIQGDSMISWSHVWGYFCLCFEHMKLLRNCDSIARFGIKNGDQLRFVRHTPLYTIAGETSERLAYGLDESEGSLSISDLRGDKQTLDTNEVNEGYKCFDSNKSSFVGKMTWFFPHGTQEAPTKRNYRVVNSTIRLGKVLPFDDANSNERPERCFIQIEYISIKLVH